VELLFPLELAAPLPLNPELPLPVDPQEADPPTTTAAKAISVHA